MPESAIVTHEEVEKKDEFTTWSCELKELQGLLDSYVVENKFSGRHPGTSLFLTGVTRREGGEVAMLPDQKWKLFLVPSLQSVNSYKTSYSCWWFQ